VIDKVKLRDSDLPPGVRLKVLPGNDQVWRQVTLDLCGADFPSESARVARLQQIAIDRDGQVLGTRGGFSDENVLYDSVESASQALDEVRRAAEQCPTNRFVRSKVASVPPLKYEISPISATQLGDDPSPDNIALGVMTWDHSGNSQSYAAVFQRRGRVMVALYGADLAAINPFVPIVAARLAALSTAEAGE
jgi:hypothetical protein